MTLALLSVILLITFAACGGDSDDDTAPAEQPSASTSIAPAAEPTTAAQPVEEPTTAPAPTAVPTEPAPEPRVTGEVDGITFIVGAGSEATFTVGEVLTSVPLPIEAVMRTEDLSGEVYLDGRESRVSINLQTLSSDQEFRDRWARSRLFGQHPTGTFILPTAIPLPEGFTEGETVNTEVTGTLELLGQTFPVTFEIQARDDGDVVVILGKTTFTWDDFNIEKPTARSVVSIEDEVRVNVLISARPV
ncbi:MAG: YceI family protein [Chloroflexi bacterium]|nr:YceI family protein [Chloroflexota bacterium]